MKLRSVVVSVVVVLALVSAGCGGGGDSTESSSGTSTAASIPADADYNATDVGFAQGMIPHHGQAVKMSELAVAQSQNPEVVDLAKRIEAAQSPEIAEMSAWLTERNQKAPDPDAGMDMSMDAGSGMEGMMMNGMLSDDDLARLEKAQGTEFDTLYLEFMIQHHEGAIEMSKAELEGGKNAEMKALAQEIIDTQQAEITEINALLAKG